MIQLLAVFCLPMLTLPLDHDHFSLYRDIMTESAFSRQKVKPWNDIFLTYMSFLQLLICRGDIQKDKEKQCRQIKDDPGTIAKLASATRLSMRIFRVIYVHVGGQTTCILHGVRAWSNILNLCMIV